MPAYLLYGEDTFSSRKKLAEIKSRFVDRNMGAINITNFNGETLDLGQFKRAAFLAPFFSPKRLIVVINFLKKAKKEEVEKITHLLSELPDFSIVVFYEEGEVDTTSVLFRQLKKEKRVERFPLLTPGQLVKWILKEVQKEGGKIDYQAAVFLAGIVGPDLWRLSLEINKLVLYKNQSTINKKDVEALVKTEVHPRVFDLIDAVAQKNFSLAIKILKGLIEAGENESYMLSMIAYQFRNLLMLKDLTEQGRPLSEIGLPAFVLAKTRRQAQDFSFPRLKEIYGKILETDINIKNGILKPHLALEILIAEIVS